MDNQENKVNWPSLLIAVPTHQGKILAEVVSELLMLVNFARDEGIDMAYTYFAGCSLVDIVRNSLGKTFRDSGYQKVLMIDDDIVFKWQDVAQMLHNSIRHPVVCATYPSRVELASLQDRFYVRAYGDNPQWTEDGLLKIQGCGAGFTIIDRSVFDTLEPHVLSYSGGAVIKGVVKPRTVHHNFFPIGIRDGEHHGEDHGFFNLCVDNGIVPVLDPRIDLGHVGTKVFRAPVMGALKAYGWLPPELTKE
jgi:hypothetical protein